MVEDETTNATGFMILVGVVLVSVILQFVMFVWFKKKTEEYCGMQLN
jgi:heme/copper-type cytochrome/quinol oxidase subunit 4